MPGWIPLALLLLSLGGLWLVYKGSRDGSRQLQAAGLVVIFAAAIALGFSLSAID